MGCSLFWSSFFDDYIVFATGKEFRADSDGAL